MPTVYISYYRVSTLRQGTSGLGLDAQRAATRTFLTATGADLAAEYTEVESGKRANRPELAAAMEQCRKAGATLLIAKLDRLARNVAFIANLLESGVKFTAIDMPNADRFMLHVYAAMAEEEARRISERTKAALAAAKARGVALGRNGTLLAQGHIARADEFAKVVGPRIAAMKDKEGLTYRDVAERLNSSDIKPFGGKLWHSTSVHRTLVRYQASCATGI